MKIFPMLLHETATTWRIALDQRLKPLGLSQAKWRALLHLASADTPLTQTDLAQKLCLEKATIVGLIDRLAREGWVVRIEKEGDRRVRLIGLTEKAISIINQIRKTADQLSHEILSTIEPSALKICISTMEQIIKNAQDAQNKKDR